jgi:hypothetical protein
VKTEPGESVRRRVDLVKEPATVAAIEDTCETPWMVLKGLHIHDFDEKYVSRGCAFNLEGPTEIVNSREVDIADIISCVIVLDLPTGPDGC